MIEMFAKVLTDVAKDSVNKIPKFKEINVYKLDSGQIVHHDTEKVPKFAKFSQSDVSSIKNDSSEDSLRGGAYKDIPSKDGCETHHMPADSITDLPRGDGPCIQMETADHRQTASWGNSKDARDYRAAQSDLIKQGKGDEAFQMDVADIKSKFGDKYDVAIGQCKDYRQQLKQEGRMS